jgi:hypothetical protein
MGENIMTIRWTRNAAGGALAGVVSFALGLTGAAAFTTGLFVFALLCGLDYTAVTRVERKDRKGR